MGGWEGGGGGIDLDVDIDLGRTVGREWRGSGEGGVKG